MDTKSYTVRVSKRWARTALIVGVTALIVAPLTAVATHSGFDDVPDSHTFVDDIAWLKDADVTRGCNPPANNLYCPEDDVTRGQMAAFMRRFSQYLGAEDGTPAQADNAATADHATTAGDADTLDGLDSTDLTSDAFLATDDGIVTVGANSTVNVITLTLPPGSYLIQGRVSVNQNGGVAGRNITCTLSAGSSSQTNENFWTEPNGGIDTLDVSFMVAHTFNATGDAVLSCEGGANWNGNVLDPTISAVSVDDVSVSVTGASEAGDPNN